MPQTVRQQSLCPRYQPRPRLLIQLMAVLPRMLPFLQGAFTVSGLSAGSHTVVVTPTGCTAVTAPAFTITGTPLTTNGSLTTSACDTYTWSAAGGNNQTYTTSGVYTNTVGCNTATLTLTINHSDAHTTTTSACNTYTWSAPLGNGTTFILPRALTPM